ncbi:MAG: hypothetical protein K0S53_3172 [Bacteroidetes bacterium]|nr:hypothetical protein [Bacteroidota bacterium]MDF2451952.1 hypothetical protein [Bacteroidota bacterium]
MYISKTKNAMKKIFVLLLICGVVYSCKKKEEEPTPEETPTTTGTPEKVYPDTVWTSTGTGPHLIFKFKFDSTQVRLNNIGQPSTVAAGNSAYSPKFNQMAAHYIELAPGDLTALGAGSVLYHAPETTAGGSTAIQFSKSTVVREGVTFFSIPLSQLTPGATYKWLRLSLSYQNYDIPYKTASHIGNGTVASFLGYKTYVTKYKIKNYDYVPSASVGGPNVNHPQGYWGFETYIPGYGPYPLDGQAPAGSTTVVNPNPNSPIPAGSCVVTAVFTDVNGNPLNLTIPSTTTNDIIVTVSLSTNKSFEFVDPNGDGYYQPDASGTEYPVDMGIRGMIPKVQY